jgi:glucan 1,3-beta-glucosidase
MGIANAQRSLNYIRTLVQFASQPQFAPIIPLFAIGNEIAYLNIGGDQVKALCVGLISA